MKIRVLSYNIHKGFDRFGLSFVIQELRHAIQATNVDIVFLQEVVGANHKLARKIRGWPQESQFEYLADSAWSHYSYGQNAAFIDRNHGNAILSRFPIKFSENINISTHQFEQRGLLHCAVNIPECDNHLIHLFNTHLDLLEFSRKKQVTKIVERALKTINGHEALILGGDFNDWPQALTREFESHLELDECFLNITGGHAKTFPSFFPVMPLDRVYFKNIRVMIAEVLNGEPWSRLSDHLPILVEFEL